MRIVPSVGLIFQAEAPRQEGLQISCCRQRRLQLFSVYKKVGRKYRKSKFSKKVKMVRDQVNVNIEHSNNIDKKRFRSSCFWTLIPDFFGLIPFQHLFPFAYLPSSADWSFAYSPCLRNGDYADASSCPQPRATCWMARTNRSANDANCASWTNDPRWIPRVAQSSTRGDVERIDRSVPGTWPAEWSSKKDHRKPKTKMIQWFCI